jgi:ArsR family transcriptional regulator, arsenate/arsenite/antimonite-responsive transcriptional repressor
VKIDFTRGASLIKALDDETRLKIVHILSCGELCACDILEYFDLTQPTLSHHLNILVAAGLVIPRPEGKWTYYSLHRDSFSFLEGFIKDISSESRTCLCKKLGRNRNCITSITK